MEEDFSALEGKRVIVDTHDSDTREDDLIKLIELKYLISAQLKRMLGLEED